MMKQDIPYGICQMYVQDLHPPLQESLRKKVLGWTRARDLKSLASCQELYDPAYHGKYELTVLRQIEAFFKKNADYAEDEVCTGAAAIAFIKAEAKCSATNRRLDSFYFEADESHPFKDQVVKMQHCIRDVLGSERVFLRSLDRWIRVTAGATATRGRRNAQPYRKVGLVQECTPGAAPFLEALSSHFGYPKIKTKLQDWNRVELVPKNWKTHRTIACEPTGNIPLQLACDSYIKSKLKKLGVDLRSQFRNQMMAREGSISGKYSTVDLEMASDTLARNTVALLFPDAWWYILDSLRAPSYTGVFGEGRYAKFSSMGNGTTFVLETLVFAAACKAVGSKMFSVYGDDIVIETELYEDLVSLLGFLGFTVNTEKSFHTGPFRESCGADWYEGVNITPVYLRAWDLNSPVLCHNVNALATICVPGGRLEEFLFETVVKYSLPLVPFDGNTQSGVWVHPADNISWDANLGVSRSSAGIRWYSPFQAKAGSVDIYDSRTLFLWYLQKHQWRDRSPIRKIPKGVVEEDFRSPNTLKVHRGLGSLPASCCSRVPTMKYKYTRQWVAWNPPIYNGVYEPPIHLTGWSERLTEVIADRASEYKPRVIRFKPRWIPGKSGSQS